MNKKIHSVLINVMVLIVCTVFMFGFAEVVMRYRIGAWPFEPPVKEMPYLTKKDIKLKWRFSPAKGFDI